MLSLYPHYVGMGLFLAWTVGNSFVLNFAETSAIENARSVDLLCGMAANILALFVIACRSDEIGSLLARRPLPLAAAVCASLGSGLIVLAGVLPTGPLAMVAAGSCLKGVGSALLFMLWSELFSRLPIKQTSVGYSAAYLVSVVAEAGMPTHPSPSRWSASCPWRRSFSWPCPSPGTATEERAHASRNESGRSPTSRSC